MLTPREQITAFIILAIGVLCAYVAGKHRPRPQAVTEAANRLCEDDHERLADYWYDEGWDDAWAEASSRSRGISLVSAESTEPLALTGPGASSAASGAIPLMGARDADSDGWRDWREQTAHDLNPRVLDAEAERLHNLPGPVQQPSRPEVAGTAKAVAGGLDYQTPLPAVLMLGAEGDGGDRTAARVQLRGMDMLTRFEQQQAEYCRRSGIDWRGLVTAA